AADERATLNLVVAGDGEIVAARTSVGTAINSLYVRSGGGASYVASEPLDPDDDWTAVEDHALVVLTPDGISTSTLEMP
ncbi:MAG: hypothetical protein GWN07_30920, partial [Actinobacteria bacterium]|nr:hypothetical protein [Actinomycetota bacterium]NIS35075.1 hypothetical protein [Actinomycetota bacterium]NIU69803.1 hypothetical protein [Actinomycetota bacterium]NIW31675.1 hypothetical protein [Actinomycetota bacterium]NIX23993.1 hypothetical protein [Actinomycetota bacterium]